jgi:hypothetical protein
MYANTHVRHHVFLLTFGPELRPKMVVAGPSELMDPRQMLSGYFFHEIQPVRLHNYDNVQQLSTIKEQYLHLLFRHNMKLK